MEILFVCTGNICRSPMAEALLRARLEQQGTTDVHVSSAGLLFDGRAAEPGAIAALDKLGVDLRPHAARKIREEVLAPADLVIAMENRHVREVSLSRGGDLARTFTFPDLVARAEAVGPRREQAFAAWLGAVVAGRTPELVMRDDERVEVSDPMGQSKRAFRRCAAELADLSDRFVAMAWPQTDAAGAAARTEPVPSESPQPTETRST